MKKVFWVLIILVVIFLVLGFLYSQGIIKQISWQPLAVIFAAAAAPFTFLKNFFSGRSIRTDKILKEQQNSMNRLNRRKENFEVYMRVKDQRIKELEAEVIKLKDDINNMQMDMKDRENQINGMSDIGELQDAFMEGYTDES